jgi:diguanylate cyclase (GGDEF)-like protein
MLNSLTTKVARLPRAVLIAVALILIAAIAVLDYLTGPQILLSIFYFLPVMFVAWSTGSTKCALIVAGAGCLVGPAEALLTDFHYVTLPVAIWNAAVRLALFCIVIYLMQEVRTLMAQLQDQATVDELTSLANLRALRETATGEIERSLRFHHHLSVAYLDIDDFKGVNDRAGHTAGDRVLITLASVARATTRSVDTVARVGGDEFVILMPETGAAAALPLLDRLRETFSRAAVVAGAPITCSIGLATFERAPASVEGMLAAADELMYEAKAAGGDTVRKGNAGFRRGPELNRVVAFPRSSNP